MNNLEILLNDILDITEHIYVVGGSVLVTCLDQLGIITPLSMNDIDIVIETDEKDSVIDVLLRYNWIQQGVKILVFRNNNASDVDISVKQPLSIIDMELPMTTMRIKITKGNLCDILEGNLMNLDITVPPCRNGLFIVRDNVQYGSLSEFMIDIIEEYSSDNSIRQFLACHLVQFDRLLVRLDKNINKVNIIFDSIENDREIPNWLPDPVLLLRIREDFVNLLHIKLSRVWNQHTSVISRLNNLVIITTGMNIGRIASMYQTYNPEIKQLIYNLFDILSSDDMRVIRKRTTPNSPLNQLLLVMYRR